MKVIPFFKAKTQKPKGADDNVERASQNSMDNAFLDSIFLDSAITDENEEEVSPSLHSRLLEIAEENSAQIDRRVFQGVRKFAIAASILVVVTLGLVEFTTDDVNTPSQAEIEKARQDFIVAMHYLKKSNQKANQILQDTMQEEIRDTIVQNLIKPVQS